MTPFRTHLAQARAEAGISQSELSRRVADITGGDPQTIRVLIVRYESEGATSDPRPPLIAAIADALGFDFARVPPGSTGKKKKIG